MLTCLKPISVRQELVSKGVAVFRLKDFQRQFELIDKDLKDQQKEIEKRIIITSPDVDVHRLIPPDPRRIERYRSPERIIRQELDEDGLISRGRSYIVEINSSAMYINGVKQPREVYKKYRRLYESLTDETLQGDFAYKMVF